MAFAHLHIHTHYSISDSIVKIPELFERAAELELSGLAITDPTRMSGVPEFLSCAKRYPDIKPVVGCSFSLTNHIPHTKVDADKMQLFCVILLAKNLTGYHNLIKLSTTACTESGDYILRISHKLLEEHHEGLICLSGGLKGEVAQALLEGGIRKARKVADWYKSLFGEDFYLEASLHKRERSMVASGFDKYIKCYSEIDELYTIEKKLLTQLSKLGKELGIKLVATNPVHFLHREDAIAHDVYYCYQIGQKISDEDRPRFTHLEYLRSEAEMRKLFSRYPEAIDNTSEILDKIERYEIHRPLSMPSISDDPKQELRAAVYDGANARYGHIDESLKERIEYELASISKNGFDGYFLIIKEMIDWSRAHGGIVGPGRGSAVGSVVNYCLGITDIDPLKYGLLFERFLNPERIQLPDIDTDFDTFGFESIHAHLEDRYGKDKVSYVSCFNPLRAFTAFELSAKTYGVRASKTVNITAHLQWRSLADELMDNPRLQHEIKVSTPRLQEAYQTAIKLDGVFYNSGIHACANLISSQPLDNVMPMTLFQMNHSAKNRMALVPASQYGVHYVEDAGVWKIDNLGLLTLDEIQGAKSAIQKRHGVELNLEEIPLDDTEAFKIYQTGDTDKIFLFESRGMKLWLDKLQPETFEQLVAMYALYRPGPMDYIPDYIARKNGEQSINYVMPETEAILSETFGLIIYQEQAMLIMQKIGGFTPGQSAKARRYLGAGESGDYLQLCAYKEEFLEGGETRGYSEKQLEEIWQQLDHTGPYLFNKSHAVAYTWLSYQTAWLKAYYREEFEASVKKAWKRFKLNGVRV